MAKTLPVWIAALAIGLSGYLHGVWTNRWAPSSELENAVARLNQVPLAPIAGWVPEAGELEPGTAEKARLAGYLMRTYRNAGNRATVLLMCGRPGPVAVHTPDVCYSGAGYQLVPPESAYPAGVEDPPFTMGVFSPPPDPSLSNLCILWSWTADGVWKSPQYPRLAFSRYRALYKLYVICDMPAPQGLTRDDPRAAFIDKLLPELRKALFGPTP